MSNITWHDYLLGVIALCLVLCASSKSIAAPGVQSAETLQLLRRARDVCIDHSMRSKDSGRVQRVVNATLLHFGSLGDENNVDALNEFSLSASPFGMSLMQSPFAGDQASAHDVVSPHSLQDFAAQQTEVDWTGSEPMTRPTDDFSWAYLEHFLNVSDDHSMPDI